MLNGYDTIIDVRQPHIVFERIGKHNESNGNRLL